MSDIGMQNAALVLSDLEESTEYKALDAFPGASERFLEFRQRIEHARTRCMAIYPPNQATSDEIRGLLEPLLPKCTARLAPFRPFIQRALAALDG
jgi:hypothetical protein